MNLQQAVDYVNFSKQRMLRDHHSKVVAFARKTLMRRSDSKQLLVEFDRLRGNAKLERAIGLMELWVPQLDNRIVPGVMDVASFDSEKEIARQEVVFAFVMNHYQQTKEVLSGMPKDALEVVLEKQEADRQAEMEADQQRLAQEWAKRQEDIKAGRLHVYTMEITQTF